jgi:hypothetical protein
MPSGYHLMNNGFGYLRDTGLGTYRVGNADVRSWNAGATRPSSPSSPPAPARSSG